MTSTTTTLGTCPRCIGGGTTPFKHIEGGVCFACGGTGKVALRPARHVHVEATPQTTEDAEHQLRSLYGAARHWVRDEGVTDWWKPTRDGWDGGKSIAYYLQHARPAIAVRARTAFIALLGQAFAADLARLESEIRARLAA